MTGVTGEDGYLIDFRAVKDVRAVLVCVLLSSLVLQRMCMRSKAWLAASVSLRLARLPPLQAGCGACGCARPSRAFFVHKTVNADHI